MLADAKIALPFIATNVNVMNARLLSCAEPVDRPMRLNGGFPTSGHPKITGRSGSRPTKRAFRAKSLSLAICGALAFPGWVGAQIANGQVVGQQPVETSGASLSYAGAAAQLGLGIDRDSRVQAQGSVVVNENATSALIAQGWLGRNAGGVRLDYNWLPGADGKPAADSLVRKVFSALDRNRDNDSKFTLGAGLEGEQWFGNAYVSRGLSGSRNVGGPVSSDVVTTVNGTDNGRPFIDTVTNTTITQYYQKAYDYGFGLRAGTWLTPAQVRLSLGLDHERGKFSSRQNTVTVGLEKFFTGSPHSVGLMLERYSKSGQYETAGSGTRALLTYRYSFGGSTYAEPSGWRETRSLQQKETPGSTTQETVRQSAPPVVATRQETRIVKTTASMTSDAFFALNKADLTPVARRELERIAQILKSTERAGNIHVVGHTCDLGSDAYNLALSVRRANAVKAYLVRLGLPADAFVAEGMGKRQPKYPNTQSSRPKNRRVDLEFVQYRDKQEIIQVPVEVERTAQTTTPPVTWQQEVIEREPVWMRRALRNTVPHKQTVDTYRGATLTHTSGTTRAWVNRVPVLRDDSFTMEQDKTASFDVLANDSDPDGNALTLAAVGAAAHGTARIVGNTLQYTPMPGYIGNDAFSYTVDDGAGGRATAMVNVTIKRTNHAPVANPDTYRVSYQSDTVLEVTSNDTDADGDSLQIVSFTQPQPATIGTIVQQGNKLVFHPLNSFSSATFSYTISDGNGGTATGTVTLIDP